MKTTILRFATLDSTNLEAARRAAAGAPEGVCVVAREQTAGRGRQLRAWASPAGAGLYLSLVLRPLFPPADWPLLTLAAAVAVAETLAAAGAPDLDIKWPNDVLTGGRKICGILAETVESGAGRAVVLGIGVNVRAGALPPELREAAVSLEEATGRAPDDPAELLPPLLEKFGALYDRLGAPGGARDILRAWSARSSYADGKRVRVTFDRESIEGTTRGLEADGALRVETTRGELRLVRAGEVTHLREEDADASRGKRSEGPRRS